MFPKDYLEAAGYVETIVKGLPVWLSPKSKKELSYYEARLEAFGKCECCGEPRAYPGAVRCGAACTAMHEAKDCQCYAQSKRPAKTQPS
jgi:hypothetical protein